MGKVEEYRNKLKELSNWDDYLIKNSNLPGPRGNLELAKAVTEEGDEKLFNKYIWITKEESAGNEFLVFCGVYGQGKLISAGKLNYLPILRKFASDERWRIREAVAMALQTYGKKDMQKLIDEMKLWSTGNAYEQRAAAAALCEPVLLKDINHVKQVLSILDSITRSSLQQTDRKTESFKALQKGLAYCWSVAVAAFPEEGKKFMEVWFSTADKDIKWIMKENLKKNRLIKVAPEWVNNSLKKL